MSNVEKIRTFKKYGEEDYAVIEDLKIGDVITFLYPHNESFIEIGIVKEENFHKDGITLYGDDWKKYTSVFEILKVVRDGEVLYDRMPKGE